MDGPDTVSHLATTRQQHILVNSTYDTNAECLLKYILPAATTFCLRRGEGKTLVDQAKLIQVLLDERFCEEFPFQTSLGLVYLRRLGMTW
jgi:hypothetical protein